MVGDQVKGSGLGGYTFQCHLWFALISLAVSISIFKNGETTNTVQNNYKEQLVKLTVKHVSTTHTVSSNCLLKKCWAIRNPAHPIWLWVTFPSNIEWKWEELEPSQDIELGDASQPTKHRCMCVSTSGLGRLSESHLLKPFALLFLKVRFPKISLVIVSGLHTPDSWKDFPYAIKVSLLWLCLQWGWKKACHTHPYTSSLTVISFLMPDGWYWDRSCVGFPNARCT